MRWSIEKGLVQLVVGLFNDVIYKILEDQQGRFWLSSNKGIFTVAKAELQDFAAGRRPAIRSTPYGTTDGMRSSECNGFIPPAGWKARDGRLYFPTIKSVVIVQPDQIKLNLLPPPMDLEQALLGLDPAVQVGRSFSEAPTANTFFAVAGE